METVYKSDDVTMILGFPSSGKSTITKDYLAKNYFNLNRDTEGGSIKDLLPKMESLLKENKKVVLDNLFAKAEVRKPFIDLAKKYNKNINCVIMGTSIEDSQFNAVQRMIDITGKLLSPEEIKQSKHPSIFPVSVLFKYKKDYEKPSLLEGFNKIDTIKFVRKDNPLFTGRAAIFDFDGTLRECINGNGQYPVLESQIEIKPGREEVIKKFAAQNYKILGVSNQSGVAKGALTYKKARELFDHTNKLLNVDIDVYFCPHQSAPLTCYCRKPQVGAFVWLMNKYKLDRKQCFFVGDFTSDQTFATRCGIRYFDQAEFFNNKHYEKIL